MHWRQNLNGSALLQLPRLLTKPSLAVPHYSVCNINDIPFHALHACGVRGVIFDKDNTLTYPYVDSVAGDVSSALKTCINVFDGHVAIISNSNGSCDDRNYVHADHLEASIGVRVLRHGVKKPNVIAAESIPLKEWGCSSSSDVVCIGDRLLTDVVFGNATGMLTIHTRLLTKEGDNAIAVKIRDWELTLLRGLRYTGVKAPLHPLYNPSLMSQLVE